ncbi:Do family serine endopeptidase [Siculibacillus lacustris]|uniref:Probable periplasmic serine endoprotease DegP-like n=1 Tax=Siculibacillus lacustris TaxID=1549641 RepID=A0A4Q9VY97_9HYPH|nr:Do family serine endopeptidase [Siculibacillus lacustris]TBW40965.1 Do family serine endopeptidase [Siculibacillus lacustris]
MTHGFPDPRATAEARAIRRKAILAGAVSLAVVGGLTAVDMLGHMPSVRAETPAASPSVVSPLLQNFSFAPIVERVRPAVVSIRVRGEARPNRESFMETFPDLPEGSPFERFFREWNGPGRPGGRGMGPQGPGQGRGPGRGEVVMSQGSGFIISPDGKVVTNFHVVKDAAEVTVLTDDGTEYKAKVLGSDEKTDVALLKIQGGRTDFPTVPFATGEIRPGDWVLAVGNPFGLGGSVTAGIVSARGREIGAGPYDDFLQIDAPINHGNSGGPTFDLAGNVVGMNTAIYSPSGGSIGIGFAIPSTTVQKVIAQLEKTGEVVRGWLGVQIQPIGRDMADGLGLKDARGALVAEALPDGPAAKAGIKAGDAILAVEGKPIKNARDLSRTIAGYDPGSKVKVTIVRAGKEQTIEVDLARMQAEARASTPAATDGAPTSLADLGLMIAPASEVGETGDGVAVVKVDPRGPAAARGIRVGDVIVEVQGRTVATAADVGEAVKAARTEGRKAVLMRVRSPEGTRFVPVPIGAS